MGRLRQRAAAGAALGLFAFAIVSVSVHGVRAQANAATRALEYLEGQQSATDGSLAGGFSVNELYVLGAAAGGYDPHLLKHGGPSVVDYLTANARAACPAATDTAPSAGLCGYLIQAALASEADPRAFGGLDIVARLNTYYDPATGKYGDAQAFTQALAILGLVAAGEPVPHAALTFVHSVEDSNGGWDYQDVRDDSANPYDTSDTNSTSLVLMALDAAGDHSRDSAGLAWLHTAQNPDGGFSYSGGPPSDPDSTAEVAQAIIATGGSPTAPAWTVGGHTPSAELAATQDASGGYIGFSGVPDAFTTTEVVPALDGVAFPIPPASQLYVPGTPLPGSPAPTPQATPTAGVNASVITPDAASGAPPVPSTGGALTGAGSRSSAGAGGFPRALTYLLLALGAAVIAAGAGLVIARR
ncbi:MAG: hypothetical protein JOZ75_14165 [Candidatus Dormibacteraeota bacterium]|nr:hypothetical protein [Candidatus Dormibacteraeota bacterium]